MSEKHKILVVEDNEQINNLIHETLTTHGYECVQAFSGTEGLLNFKNDNFDLLILDLMMPGLSGEELTKKVRETSKVPIIIASAKSDLDSKIDLLSSGADDFLPKPFEIKELLARVEVQMRHLSEGSSESPKEDKDEILTHKGLKLNKTTYDVSIDGNEISLTRQEFKILELFLLYPTKVFSKQDIFEYAWDEYYIGEDKTINVHISNIRTKLKKYSEEEYIDTVWGIGFRLAK